MATEQAPPPPPPSRAAGTGARGIGDVVAGRYRITGVVGKGAMGAVFAAEHAHTGQKVALKFMIVGDEDGQEFIARFEQEAKVMAGLRNSHTIRIYDFGHTEDGALFMAMELLVGKPLDKHLRDLGLAGQTMTERDAGQLAVQMLRSLGEAHGLGLVHRDMKPGNVFLNDDGSGDTMAKVLDFGLARVNNSALTNVGRIMGTPAYMSPEQWQGANVGPAADLYAVGCMMFAMVTGDAPYQSGENVLSLMHKHCTEDIPDPREKSKNKLSDGFVQVTRRAMAKHADDRFPDAKSMRMALEAVLGGSWTSSIDLGTASQLSLAGAKHVVGGTAADQATIAADGAALRQKSQKNVAFTGSEDATIAGVLNATRQSAIGTASSLGQAAPAKKPWAAIAIAAVVVAAAGAWFATRGDAPAEPAPAIPAAAPVATAPVAAPLPAAAAPVAALPPAPVAAIPPAPAPVAAAPAPDAAVPTPPAPTTPKPKAARPAPAKKKATTLETVD